ncbi:hypothetical protein GCM10018793_35560 [Streptomyces sulfonofaciens]|uniref:Uncharacterized protein n=1 Tax=Streptomyces sulfonofaciens TaxID=68272 RepID=A0A919GAL8_9ACTN|nr:hypothetical protein GCM10018793_35560 [Streptomyces sulfonofaciens]
MVMCRLVLIETVQRPDELEAVLGWPSLGTAATSQCRSRLYRSGAANPAPVAVSSVPRPPSGPGRRSTGPVVRTGPGPTADRRKSEQGARGRIGEPLRTGHRESDRQWPIRAADPGRGEALFPG